MSDALEDIRRMADVIFSEWNLFGPWREQKNVDYENVLKVDKIRRYALSMVNSGIEWYNDILGECRVFLIEYFQDKLNAMDLRKERDEKTVYEISKFVYLQEQVTEDNVQSIKELEETYDKAWEKSRQILKQSMEKGLI